MKKATVYLSVCAICLITILTCLSLTLLTSHTVSVISESLPFDDRKCVIIDAGHGGIDSGAVSCTGVYESKLNLEFAHRLNDILNLLGIKTVMLRSTDADLSRGGESISARKLSDLKERVRIVNETQNCILISIHQNYFHNEKYRGAQIFYTKTSGSKDIADRIQLKLRQTVAPENKRETKKCSGIYLMDRVQCSAILIECGFLSNIEEEAKLRETRYQQNFCSTVATEISGYLNT